MSPVSSCSSTDALNATQLAARFEPELVPQLHADPLARGERVGLPAAAIERHDEVTPQAFAERELADERLELTDELRMPPRRPARPRSDSPVR